MATIDELFKKMVERKASDMHLTIGNPPLIRAKGDLVPLEDWVDDRTGDPRPPLRDHDPGAVGAVLAAA